MCVGSLEVDVMSFLRRRRRLEVDVGVLELADREALVVFLRSNLKVDVVLGGGRVGVDSDVLSGDELRRLVMKFVYHRNLNKLFWVGLDGDVVRVRRLEKAKKQEKSKRGVAPPRVVTHGW